MAAVVVADEQRRVARWFCAVCLVVGVANLVFAPPFAVSRELHELAHAYPLSRGRTCVPADDGRLSCDLPRGWRELAKSEGTMPDEPHRRLTRPALFKRKPPPDDDGIWSYRNPAPAQPPLAYGGLLPGLWLAQALSLPGVWHIYLARVSSLGLFCGLVSVALSMAGRLNWGWMALALAPALMAQAAGATPDGLIVGLVFLFVARLEHAMRAEAGLLPSREGGALLGTLACLVCCNPACAVFGLGLGALHWSREQKSSQRWLLAALAVAASWALATGLTYLTFGTRGLWPSQTLAQLAWMGSHPLKLLATVARTLFRNLDDYGLQFLVVRDTLSTQMRLSAGMVATLTLELLVLLAYGSARSGASAPAPARARVYWACAGLFVAWVFASALLASPKLGPGELQNISGQAFFPMGPVAVAALAYTGRPFARHWLLRRGGRRALLAIVAINLVWLFLMFARYYFRNSRPWKY